MTALALTAPHRQRSLSLAVLCGVLFLTFLDNTVVSVALADLQPELHAGVTDLQWVVNAYALVFAAAMLPAGAIGDEFGRRRVLLAGIAVFCLGSVLAALAPSVGVLVAGRAVMGLGAAGSEPGTLSVLRQLFPDDRERARAVGVWAAVSGLALAAGPVVGGLLVGLAGWRSIFWANLAAGAVLLLFVARVVPESRDPRAGRVDASGGLLAAATVAALVGGIVEGETRGYGAPPVLALLAASVVALAGFLWRERRTDTPLIDPALVRDRVFAVACLAAFTTYFGTFSVFFFTALYLQEVAGQSGLDLAAQFAPMAAALVAGALLAGRWTAARGARAPVASGCVLFAAGLVLTAVVLRPDPSGVTLPAVLALAGLGIGLAVVPVTYAALSAAPPQRSGMAASATNTSRELGAVIGVAVLGALVNARLTGQLAAALDRIGVPASFQGLVVGAVEHGGLPSQGQGVSDPRAAGAGGIVQKVIAAAFEAFGAALHVALYTSAALVAVTAVVVAVSLPGRRVAG